LVEAAMETWIETGDGRERNGGSSGAAGQAARDRRPRKAGGGWLLRSAFGFLGALAAAAALDCCVGKREVPRRIYSWDERNVAVVGTGGRAAACWASGVGGAVKKVTAAGGSRQVAAIGQQLAVAPERSRVPAGRRNPKLRAR
jgi:hypothetical protein